MQIGVSKALYNYLASRRDNPEERIDSVIRRLLGLSQQIGTSIFKSLDVGDQVGVALDADQLARLKISIGTYGRRNGTRYSLYHNGSQLIVTRII